MIRNNPDWSEPMLKFSHYFHYDCQIPPETEIDSFKDFKDFSDVVDKCIRDDFDYTIAMYGTVPPKSFELPEIIVD